MQVVTSEPPGLNEYVVTGKSVGSPSTIAHGLQNLSPMRKGKVEFVRQTTGFFQLVRHGPSAVVVEMLGCYVVPAVICSYSVVAEYTCLPAEVLHFVDHRRSMWFEPGEETLNVLSEGSQSFKQTHETAW